MLGGLPLEVHVPGGNEEEQLMAELEVGGLCIRAWQYARLRGKAERGHLLAHIGGIEAYPEMDQLEWPSFDALTEWIQQNPNAAQNCFVRVLRASGALIKRRRSRPTS